MIIDPKDQSVKENYKLMIGSIVPRPIAFVSTQSSDGILNLAPFSFFNGICSNPPTIMFAPVRKAADGGEKDTLINIRDTGQFAVNVVSEDFADEMVTCATEFGSNISEFEASGLTPVPCEKIACSRVNEAKITFECELNQIVEIGDGSPGSGFLVLGTIILFHLSDSVYKDGYIDLAELRPIGRLAGSSYTRVTDTFDIKRKIKPDNQ